MDFIDEVVFEVKGGRGGDGCISFRREKFVPKGGPDGGDGGDAGHVILRVNRNLSTLSDLRHRKHYRSGSGQRGRGKCMHGKKGESIVIQIPPGTIVRDADTQEELGDLIHPGQELVVAHGGKGGKGNARFATPTCQAPDYAHPGSRGEERRIELNLKLLADVGLVGLPNAGKSTLLSRISSARPKVADYPFTTTAPNLGIVYYDSFKSFVVADIPGLIEGAHHGKGMGDRFLRHIERTRILIFLLEAQASDLEHVYKTLINEIERYSVKFLDKPWIMALSKIDLLSPEVRKTLPASIDGHRCYPFSAVTGEGVQYLLDRVISIFNEAGHE